MEEQHEIQLIGNDQPLTATFSLLMNDGGYCDLTCTFVNRTIRAREWDFFEALCTIRKELERSGLRPHCYGASLNAFPSAMSRDMGKGLAVYQCRMGKPGEKSDLVKTFATGDDVILRSVAEQKQYRTEWFESLGNRTD